MLRDLLLIVAGLVLLGAGFTAWLSAGLLSGSFVVGKRKGDARSQVATEGQCIFSNARRCTVRAVADIFSPLFRLSLSTGVIASCEPGESSRRTEHKHQVASTSGK